MSPFVPEFEGEITLDPVPEDFVARLARRVEAGFLSPGMRSRADYRVASSDRDSITIRAHGFLTIYNVGLNEIVLTRQGAGTLCYRVTFWGWTRTAVVHGLLLGAIFVALYVFVPQMRRDVASYSHGFALLWSIVGFLCVLWPWLLAAMHRGPARQALLRILRETLADRPESQGPGQR